MRIVLLGTNGAMNQCLDLVAFLLIE